MQAQKVNRRDWIKRLGFTLAISNVAGKRWASTLASEIQPTFRDGAGILRVDLATFPVLDQPFGSVRIGTSPMQPDGKNPVGLFKPILINRGANMEVFVMSAECTHEGCSVPTYNQQAALMICPCHGSHYEIDGTVVGGPAMQSLLQYPFTNQDGKLAIEIPDLFFDVTAQVVTTSQDRIGFKFLAFMGIYYQVFFRQTLDGPGTSCLFSLTPEGPFTERRAAGIDDDLVVYLPKPRQFGYYEVAMVTMPV